ncbi:hypothetical protein N6H18_07225 [Reichenbachiella agarivorans]|uniref:DNA mismatch repair proteins mutS family domain-containing protein n=1 Tax=Reichenbachiella agarivorans TaxID=2979464 RepID=A0ABY6CWB7_9BACT|nr:hypothetical protein [Reichenbachiella agarivorans]UXP33743.1 hypothetical protein N6H18_07225 [Reichenbachiella agarivorans]
MSQQDKVTFFQERRQYFERKYQKKRNQSFRLGWVRVLSFLAMAILLYFLMKDRETSWAIYSLILYLPVFGQLVNLHNKKKNEANLAKHLIQINEEEVLRLERKLKTLPDGKKYAEHEHPYSSDLDIFGTHSLFQLLNRSHFEGSRQTMALWLNHPADHQTILRRQQSIIELKDDIDWCQTNMAHSYSPKAKKDEETQSLSNILSHLAQDTKVLDKKIWHVAQVILPLLAMLTLVAHFWLGIDFRWIFLPMLINVLFLRVIFAPLLNLTRNLEGITHLLSGYESFLRAIEKRAFESSLLQELKSTINQEERASKVIKQLKASLHLLTNRGNLFYQVLNSLFVLDIFMLQRVKNWHKHYGHAVIHWLEAADQVSVIADLAAFSFAHEEYRFPTVDSSDIWIQSAEMSHPLLACGKSVSNDFALSGRGHLALITGSNMSGKSTFLRTLGINLVLAQMGAPVSASSFRFTPIRLFSSMRTQDNLEESVSSFYAEIRRIKQLLDQINEEKPTLYLLDEILKGTNTKDRHAGAIALIEQLTAQNCIGLISTHDVELAELINPKMINFSFNSTLVNDEILFDYKLTNGPCRSFNASALMKKMGIIKK